jgi:hypothetical protein
MSGSSEEKSLLTRLEQIDPKYLYAIQIIALSIILIRPIGMPVQVADVTQMAFNSVDSIQPGDIVVFGNEISARGYPEDGPIAEAFLNHLFAKGAKVIILTIEEAEGVQNYELRIRDAIDFKDAVQYEDWVHLGFVTGGGEIAAASFAEDIHSVFPTDYENKPISQIPMMQNVKDINDVDWLVVVAGSPTRSYLRQIQSPYGTNMVSGCGGVMAGEFLPFVGPDQIQGLVVSLSGAAQYESLLVKAGLGSLGGGTKSLDAMSIGYLIVMIAIIIGNIAYAIRRSGGQ